MRRRLFILAFSLFLALFPVACVSTPPSDPLFLYVHMGNPPSLVFQHSPDVSQPLGELPLPTPTDCTFWSLTPAPRGPFAALEWQCPDGPVVQSVDVRAGKVNFLLDDRNVDSHFLAWSPDGASLYLKTGTLSNPQIIRMALATRHATSLPVSPETYSLSPSPDGTTLLYAFTRGIGFGSEVRAISADGTREQKVLSDPDHIVGLMRYSPDGKRVAAIRLPDGQSELPSGELWLVNADGSYPRLVALADAGRGMFPVWSPDGTQIAFAGRARPDDPTSINLSLYNVSTSQILPTSFALAAPPVWSPDGARLYFTLASDGKMELWFYEISGGKAQKLQDGVCCPGWLQ